MKLTAGYENCLGPILSYTNICQKEALVQGGKDMDCMQYYNKTFGFEMDSHLQIKPQSKTDLAKTGNINLKK